jgi:hypothetical protein
MRDQQMHIKISLKIYLIPPIHQKHTISFAYSSQECTVSSKYTGKATVPFCVFGKGGQINLFNLFLLKLVLFNGTLFKNEEWVTIGIQTKQPQILFNLP